MEIQSQVIDSSLRVTSQIHWVKPAQPTRLDGCLSMPVRGLDELFTQISVTWIVRGVLEVSKLQRAISLTLAVFPHAAGRLKKDKLGRWNIMLTKSMVPLMVSKSTLEISDKVIREGHPDLFDPIPWGFLPPDDVEEHPLVRFKVVWLEATGDTAITMHLCHVLGDAVALSRLMNTVSDFYQGKPPSGPLPTYEKYFDPPIPFDEADYERTIRHLPSVVQNTGPQDAIKIFGEMFERSERIDLSFSDSDLRALQSHASRASGFQVSRGDALIAYFFTAFNRVYPYTFNQFMNLLEFRDRTGQVDDDGIRLPTESAAGNVVLHVLFDEIPEEKLVGLGDMATVVRQTVIQGKNREFLKRCVALTEKRFGEIAAAGAIPGYLPKERALAASLLHKIKFHDAHFGYPESCRAYTDGCLEHYFRVTPANPIPKDDGTFESNVGGVDVSFRVRKEYRDELLSTVRADMEHITDETKFLLAHL